MLTVRRNEDIHREDGGWFEARWHFSFDRYQDPEQDGIGALLVFNDDRIVAGAEWPMHPHRDIESLTYVVGGHFEHADSLGNGGQLEPGAAQVMSFGHGGALHSERNGSPAEPMRFIQFWILPSTVSRESTVQQRQYTVDDRTDRWLKIMSPPGEDGLDLRQDARVSVAHLSAGAALSWSFEPSRAGYVYVIDGNATVNEDGLATGDAVKIEGPEDLLVAATGVTEMILVDAPLRYRPVGVWARR